MERLSGHEEYEELSNEPAFSKMVKEWKAYRSTGLSLADIPALTARAEAAEAERDALVKEVRRLREEKLEREKGCEYCTGDVDERPTLIDSNGEYVYIDGNGKLTLNDMDDVQIRFCPMCGKSLKEVANER